MDWIGLDWIGLDWVSKTGPTSNSVPSSGWKMSEGELPLTKRRNVTPDLRLPTRLHLSDLETGGMVSM